MKNKVLSTSVVLKGEKLACKKDPDPILVDSVFCSFFWYRLTPQLKLCVFLWRLPFTIWMFCFPARIALNRVSYFPNSGYLCTWKGNTASSKETVTGGNLVLAFFRKRYHRLCVTCSLKWRLHLVRSFKFSDWVIYSAELKPFHSHKCLKISK